MFSAQAAPLAASGSTDMTATWSALVLLDITLMDKVHECKRATKANDKCAAKIAAGVARRRESLEKWMPSWRLQAAKTQDPILRQRAAYQVGVGHLLLGDDKKGMGMLRTLARQDSAFAPLAMASMGDYLWKKQSNRAAQALYLQAASSDLQSIHPYAHYMQGWASAEEGKPRLALQAMSLAYSKILSAPEQLQHAMLSLYVLEALAPVYAASGRADKAAEFIAQFKLPARKQRAWLTRLGSSYATQGQHQAAMQVYQRLAYEATPRQRAFYAHRWLSSRRVAAPRVDRQWSQVMVGWIENLPAATKGAAVEAGLYRQAAIEEQRACVEQAKLRPELGPWCLSALKAFLTKLPVALDSEEMLFEYARLSQAQGDLDQARWAWTQLAQREDSVYRAQALKSLKKTKK